MINPNELRLSNLVEWADDYVRVKGITDELLALDDEAIEVPIEEVNPIKLTVEILEASGFGRGNGGYIPCWWHGNNPVTQDFLIVVRFSITAKCFFIDNVYHKIYYVHQLQNWYFLKSGEELRLTIPANDKA
jgi:hypothetical protein